MIFKILLPVTQFKIQIIKHESQDYIMKNKHISNYTYIYL